MIYADEPLVRAGLRTSLDRFQGVRIVDETAHLPDALARARAREIDALLACPSSGCESDPRLNQFGKHGCPVVLLTEPNQKGHLVSGARAGVRLFVDKSSSTADLEQAIVAAARGEAFLSPAFAGAVLDWLTTRVLPGTGTVTATLDALSPREREVLDLLGSGRSNTQIARHLGIQETTVRSHVSNVLTKLQLQTRSEAAIVGYQLALLDGLP